MSDLLQNLTRSRTDQERAEPESGPPR